MTGGIGRYIFKEQIGAGARTIVWLAEDLELDREVAIKLMPRLVSEETRYLDALRSEVELAAGLYHPNITRVYDFLVNDAYAGIVMELLPDSLDMRILIGGPISESEVIELSIQICQALEYGHGRRVVHRNIKPHNILLDDDGTPKVTDFGIARATDVSTTATGKGTALYMSPEQCRGDRRPDQRSDIYAIGVVMYEMLTGHPPFTGSFPQLFQAHTNDPIPDFPTDLNISSGLSEIIRKCMDKDPEERYQKATDVVSALGSITLEDGPVSVATNIPPYSSNTCPNCDETLQNSRFCTKCGTRLNSDVSTSEGEFSAGEMRNLNEIERIEGAGASELQPDRGAIEVIFKPSRWVWVIAILSFAAAIIFLAINSGEIIDAIGGNEPVQSKSSSFSEVLDLYNSGVAYNELGQYERAIQDFDMAIVLDPQHSNAYNNRGFAYNELGQYERAIPDLDRAIELDPQHSNAYNNRGISYYGLGETERAIPDLDKAIELDPQEPRTYYNRGIAYSKLGQSERAIQDYDKAIEFDPQQSMSYNNRGFTYNELGQYERAIPDLDKAIELDPQHSKAYNNRGISYYGLGQYERSIQDYDKAIELDPQEPYAYYNRGTSYGSSGQYERAIEDFDKAIQIDPQYLEAYHNRGVAYELMGKLDKAKADFAKSEQLER